MGDNTGEVLGVEGAQHPRTVSASGSTLTLTLYDGSAAQVSDTVTLTYAGSELKGTDGKRAPMFRDLAVTNNTGTENIPAPERAEVRAAGTQLRVHFNKALNASSLPAGSAFRLTVQDGDADYRYIAGTGTAALGAGSTFVNVTLARAVRPDEQAKLEYAKPANNPLQGTDTGNPAVLSFYSFPVAWITDDTAPAFAGGTVVQTSSTTSKMALYFDEALDAAFEPATGDFAVATGATAVTVSDVAVAGRSAVLTLGSAASEGTAFTVSYTPGTIRIRDKAGNAAAAFRQTLNASAAGQPGLDSAVVDGHRVTLTFDKPLDPESAPAAGQFTLYYPAGVAGGGTTYNIRVASVAVAGRTVVLSLNHPVYPCAGASPFTLSYAVPTESPLQGLDDTDTAALDTEAVRNDRGGWCGLGWFANARNGSVIIRAKRPFDTSVALSAAWFAVTASGGPVTVTGAAFSADDPHELTLSLDREFGPDETVTVSYTRPPGESGLWDVTGKQLADLAEATVTIAAALPARLESAAMEPQGRGLVLTFTQDIAHSSAHGSYTVTVDGERRATVRVFWQDDTVGLVLAEPVRWGQVVTVAYAKPSSGVMLYGANRRAVESFGPVTVSNAVARSANSPATGAPAIGGTARVGETLTATTANIADPDGLTGASYAVQWLSNAGGADAEIAGATASTYTLTAAEEGRTVRVRVTFTDDAGNAEALVSAATAAVLPPLPPLTAEFVGLPAEHNGKRLFTFELRFSENFPGRFDYRILRDHAFQVTEGRVRKAQRAAPGQNRRWTISVRPSSWQDVTVTLPATTDCAAAGAICAPDGRMLSNTVTATVRGPAALSVADAEAHEGADQAVEFRVTLGRAASNTVTVDYATADGTAVAGEDYTATRGTLSFAEGELEKTVSVPILDDALDEGSETFTLRLRNAQGAAIADGEATGTITNADPLQKMWLSRFGRTVAGHVTEAVSDRLANTLSGAQVTLGGQGVDLARMDDGEWADEALVSVLRALGVSAGPETDPGGWEFSGAGHPAASARKEIGISGRELLLGSAFQLAGGGEGGGPGLAAWGRVTAGGFDGTAPAEAGTVRVDGEVTTAILGTDAEWDRLLAGVAVSVSEGEGRFDQPGVDSGTIDSTMTTAGPYARLALNDRVSAWGLAGFGTGDLTVVQAANGRGQPERVTRTDLGMRLAALGARGVLMKAGNTGVTGETGGTEGTKGTGGIDLVLKADAFLVETEADPVSNEGRTTARASRVRLILEGSRAFGLGGGAVLTPGMELGLRQDGGDAETGTGVELGGRVRYANPASGLSLEASVRALVAHADSDYGEWGASAAVRLDPGARGRGLSLRLAPAWGAPGSGVDRLWGASDARGLAPGAGSVTDGRSATDGRSVTDGRFRAGRRLEGEIGYGLPAFGGRYTGTPNLGFSLSDSAREYRLGWRLAPATGSGPRFGLSLDATRGETVGNEPPAHGIVLRAAVRW
ncbi:MAG: hypothetical protein F4206_00040 [Gammaproteobacteria bacterium]|nr:hypothetical protein [Gammaproteobacteria bacterium]